MTHRLPYPFGSSTEPASEKPALYGPVSDHIDGLCDDFEQEWISGNTPRIEDYLADVAGDEMSTLLRELVALDVDYRRRSGEQPSVHTYIERFPDHSELLKLLFLTLFGAGLPTPPRGRPQVSRTQGNLRSGLLSWSGDRDTAQL